VLGTDPTISEYQVRRTGTGAEVLVAGLPDAEGTPIRSQRRYSVTASQAGDPGDVDQRDRTSRGTRKLKRFIAL
jgi:hypothetical protein